MKKSIIVTYLLTILLSLAFLSACGGASSQADLNQDTQGGKEATDTQGGKDSAEADDEPYVLYTTYHGNKTTYYNYYEEYEDGLKCASYTVSDDGEIVDNVYIWTYNDDGNIAGEALYDSYRYDPVKEAIYVESPARDVTTYEYDDSGVLTTSIKYSPDITLTCDYDVDGHIVREMKEYLDYDSAEESIYTYDEYGNVLTEEVQGYSKGEPTVKTVFTHEYEYDSHHNITKDYYYATFPSGDTGVQYSTEFEYEYDGDNIMEKLDVNNSSVEKYWYNDKGNLVSKTEYSSSGKQISAESYTYDASGTKLISSTIGDEENTYVPFSSALENQYLVVAVN